MKLLLVQRVRELSQRKVRHHRVWIVLHVLTPWLWGLVMLVGANHFFDRLTRHLPWGWVLYLVAVAVNSVYATSAMSQRRDRALHLLNDSQFELLDVDDAGELLEVGPGWRKLKMTALIRKGHGRLQRETLAWSEWAVHPDNPQLQPLSFSDLDGEQWRAGVRDAAGAPRQPGEH